MKFLFDGNKGTVMDIESTDKLSFTCFKSILKIFHSNYPTIGNFPVFFFSFNKKPFYKKMSLKTQKLQKNV